MMKIKTSLLFKFRRMAEYTEPVKIPVSSHILNWLKSRNAFFQREKMTRELFHSCVILKNLAVVHQNMPMTADFILEQMMESSQSLRFVYADILTAYRNGKGTESFQILCHRLPIKQAQGFARILCRLDELNPAELIMQMNAFEETFTAERKTRAMARAEHKSLVTTLASTVTIFVVLLNFVVVVVFLDALQILNQLF